MKILKNCVLVLALVLTFCPKTFGQTSDCGAALAACKADCAGRKIVNRVSGHNLTHSDFQQRCEQACEAGLKPCQNQESENSCKTFANHCDDACPWKVYDKYVYATIDTSDSFRQCMNSCAVGSQACRPVAKKLPLRKRTGPLDVCAEAQSACYADCMVDAPTDQSSGAKMEGSSFPDLCAGTCAKAVPRCKAAKQGEDQCYAYFNNCRSGCPQSITDEDGNEQSNTDSAKLCEDACREGKAFCRDLLHLAIDGDDLDAIGKKYDDMGQ